MNKHFLFSGFLYHSSTQKILLQSSLTPEDRRPWTLLGGQSQDGKTAEENFRDHVQKLLKLKLPKNSVYAIYDYHSAKDGKKHHISYAEVDKLEVASSAKNLTFSWFSQKEILKLNLSPQTKQDIIVGQRVINSSVRRKAGERTIG